MINAVIFDLDGLLADTEKLHLSSYKTVFSKVGFELSDEDYANHWIRDGQGTDAFIAKKNLAVDPDVVRREKALLYKKLVSSSAELMPGACELLCALKGKKAMALATSSHPKDAHEVLKALDIEDFFSYVAAKFSVERIKPFPDIFLYVAKEMNIPPENCLVMEDAEKGILSADAAGMKSIAVPNIHTMNNDFSKATLVVKSLEAVSYELIDQL
ncbi:MAG: HAD family phosphatase [Sedimentisphaerales bacterium]|nr:HAD family phosphatase [Sedimentisphaerales bacterium]